MNRINNTKTKKDQLRILHLPVLILNQGTLYTNALRKLGHKCDYLLYDISQEDIYLHNHYDINLGLTDKTCMERFKTIIRFIHESIDQYDIYHFHSGRTFIPLMAFSRWSPVPNWLGRYLQFFDFLDLPYLKKRGKKLVFQFWGCDIRDPYFERGQSQSACLVCPPGILKVHCNRKLKDKINRLTMKYGDVRLSSGDLNVCYKDFLWIENAIDTDFWKPIKYEEIPVHFRCEQTDAIKVYHSFSKSDSRNDVKGTEYIVKAINNLKDEGHKVKLMFFNYTPHDDIRFYQMQADIVVDQLKCGHYGNTGVECLSMGKPVVCYLRDDVERLMPKDHPIIKADIHNIESVLRQLIIDLEYRRSAGVHSREFAVKHHDFMAVGRRLEEIYYSIP